MPTFTHNFYYSGAMGIVRKQSIYSSIFIIIGFAIGAVNTLFLYLKFLSAEQYGLTAVFVDFFTFFSVLSTFGATMAFYKFYPLYNSHLGRKNNDLPFLALLTSLIGCTLLIISTLALKDVIIRKFSKNSPLFVTHFYHVLPLTVSLTMMGIFEVFAFMLKRTAVINFIKEVIHRLVQTVIILLFGFGIIDFEQFILLYSLMYIPSVIMMAYVAFSQQGMRINFKISRVTKRIYKKILAFSMFHFSGVVIVTVPATINGFFIAGLSSNGLRDVGIFMIAKYMATTLSVPNRAMRGIASATIAEGMHERSYAKVNTFLKKTSLTLLIISILIFGLIFSNIKDLISLTKGAEFYPAVTVFLILGVTKIFENSMGFNEMVLSLSKYWRLDFMISTAVIILSLPINYFLIKESPLIGAAVADMIVIGLIYSIRYYSLFRLFHIQPYTKNTVYVLGLGTVGIIICLMLPAFNNIIVDMGFRSLVFGLFFVGAVLALNLSQDLTDMFKMALGKVWNRKH